MTRKGTTVTVTVENPMTATTSELIEALAKKDHKVPDGSEKVEYINSRKDDGRVCFGITWEVP